MKHVVYGAIVALSVLCSCGSVTVPAAVKMSNGEALVGTTTAALSGGTFQVQTATGAVSCSGNYDALIPGHPSPRRSFARTPATAL